MKRLTIPQGPAVIAGLLALFVFALLGTPSATTVAAQGPTPSAPSVQISPQTQTCIGCHSRYTPGIVEDWLASRHAKTTPANALKVAANARRVSSESIPDALQTVAVGCFECHSQNASAHKDSFQHMGFQINVIVSPNDCKTCHAAEVKQYADSKKAHAIGNLQKNAVYDALVATLTGVKEVKSGKINSLTPSDTSKAGSCYACHGTTVTVAGTKKVKTAAGEFDFPDLTNWPNQGVGRINPDGSMGSCTACHPRHEFSIEVARKPYTCSQCHLEPDVPAWDVYRESKHASMVFSRDQDTNWTAVPWQVGKDFHAPSCATCHNSLIVSPTGDVIAPRTHDFGARLWVRAFGLVYSAPQPKSGDTSVIKNKDGLPLPTTFGCEQASDFLIDSKEQATRQAQMQAVCEGCHSTSWTNQHFARMDTTIAEADKMVAASTQLLSQAWTDGIVDKTNPFDEAIEQMWVKQWLFYANSLRYAAAMPGAPDYATFKNGWWDLTNNLQEMKDMIDVKSGKK